MPISCFQRQGNRLKKPIAAHSMLAALESLLWGTLLHRVKGDFGPVPVSSVCYIDGLIAAMRRLV